MVSKATTEQNLLLWEGASVRAESLEVSRCGAGLKAPASTGENIQVAHLLNGLLAPS